MKVLFISALLPYPLHSGGQIRIFHLLKRLTKHHEITLLSFIRHRDEEQYERELSFCKSIETVLRGSAWQGRYIVSSVLGKYPFLLATYNNQEMKAKVAQELTSSSYDLIHIEPFYVWPSLPKTSVPVVIGEHNIEYEVYQQYVRQFPFVPLRPALYLDTLKLRFWEQHYWKKASAIAAVSEYDEKCIRKFNMNVIRVPNGVDLKEFSFKQKREAHKAPRLLFVGNFSWLPNRDAVKKLITIIWPLVQTELPGGTLRIVGRNIPGWINRIASRGLSVQENVHDIRKEYQDADILIAPVSIAGGTKFKLLEAFASGLPVITSTQGIAGLGAKNGVHYLEASKSDDYVAQIRKIWENKNLADKLTREARRLVEEKYSWDSIAVRLEEVWKNTYEKS